MALYPTIANGYAVYGSNGFPLIGDLDTTALEDFENQSIAVYGDDTGSFEVQGSNVLQGRYSLESTVAQRTIGASENDRPTPRGTSSDPTEYKARMVLSDSGQASLLTNCQSAGAPWENCYVFLLDTNNDFVRLFRRESGDSVTLERPTVSTGLSTGTEYRPAIILTEEGIKGVLYDRTDSIIVETDAYYDETHSGGGLGWHNGVGTTTYFDYATSSTGEIGEVSQQWLDNFEDGDLDEYWVMPSSGDANVTPGAAYQGSYGLEMEDYGEVQTYPGDGAQGYIESGQAVLLRINFQAGGDNQYWMPFSPRSSDERRERYRLEFNMTGDFRIRKILPDATTTVEGTSSQDRQYAALYDVDHHTDVWYSALLYVDEDEGLYAELHDGGGNVKGWIESPDTQYVESVNGYGFYSSDGGHVYIDGIHQTSR